MATSVRAVIYARVSTLDQEPENQLAEIKKPRSRVLGLVSQKLNIQGRQRYLWRGCVSDSGAVAAQSADGKLILINLR